MVVDSQGHPDYRGGRVVKEFVDHPNGNTTTNTLDVPSGSFNHEDSAPVSGLSYTGVGTLFEEVGEFFW